MIGSCITLVTILSLYNGIALGDTECSAAASTKLGFNLVVQSKRSETGEWVTTFVAQRDMDNKTDTVTLDLNNKIVECEGKQIFHIQGTFRDKALEKYVAGLLFHQRCGKNIGITNNGRTIQKLNVEDRINAVAFTNRPLQPNELFEVKLDTKTDKLGYFMGIGVTTHSPNDIEIPAHMNSVKTGTWMLYHNHVFNNGTVLIQTQNLQHLDKLQIGERVGVMKSDTGTLHLFVNGANRGPVASNIPYTVYGVFEFYGDLAKVTITNTASPSLP